MKKYSVNIVSFDVPYPPNYGGVIDVYFKIKTLYKMGVDVHLHAFEYGRGEQIELNKICASVTYYPRKKRVIDLFKNNPFIVASRNNKALVSNLKKNNYPILLEGLHTCAVLEKIKNRNIVVRTHNVEHNYYAGLADAEESNMKRKYFQTEASKLALYERVLGQASSIAAISYADKEHFLDLNNETHFVSVFHGNDEVKVKSGIGSFALYHGNLSVAENHKAAEYLITEVFRNLDYDLVIAGSYPSAALVNLSKSLENVTLIPNPTEDQINTLLIEAQIHVLPTFQATGVKLKLLKSLYTARHIVVNKEMVEGTDLGQYCTVCELSEMQVNILSLKAQEADPNRKDLMLNYDMKTSAEKLLKLLTESV